MKGATALVAQASCSTVHATEYRLIIFIMKKGDVVALLAYDPFQANSQTLDSYKTHEPSDLLDNARVPLRVLMPLLCPLFLIRFRLCNIAIARRISIVMLRRDQRGDETQQSTYLAAATLVSIQSLANPLISGECPFHVRSGLPLNYRIRPTGGGHLLAVGSF